MEIEQFIQDLPKVELHIHLEGTLSPELRWQLAKKNGVTLPYSTFEGLKATYFPWDASEQAKERTGAAGLPFFLEQYYGGMEVLRTEDDYYHLTRACLAKMISTRVRHAEIFFDIQAHTRRGVPVETVMNGLNKARQEVEQDKSMTCLFILCFLRDMSVDSAQEAYDACRPYQHTVFSGIGLDSNEHNRPPKLFDAIFVQAREDGLKVTSHCDVAQKNTHEHIRQCASTLCNGKGLDRIDHGMSAVDKPELIELIKGKGLGLTLAPHCYHRRWPTDVVFGSIRKLLDAGVKITVNSDDPAYMEDFWVADCFQTMRDEVRCTDAELVQLVRNSVDICWASEARKGELESEVVEFSKKYCLT